MYANIHFFHPGMGPYPPRVVLAHAGSYRSKKPSASAWIWTLGWVKKMAEFLFEM